MPQSRNRRKNGKRVKNNPAKRAQRIQEAAADQPSGVSLQDLINVLAYQEYEKRGEFPSQQTDPEYKPLGFMDESGIATHHLPEEL